MRPRVPVAVVVFFSLAVSAAIAQTVSGRVTGKVIDASGQPGAGMQVSYTNSTTQRVYKAKTDKDGSFAIVGIAPGEYQVQVFSTTGEELYAKKMSVTAAGLNAVTLDLGAATSGAHKYTREEIEAMKKQRDQAAAQNALITQALNAMNARQWQDAVAPLEQLIAADPSRYEFYQSLGDAQYNLAQYEKAIQSYQQGIDKAQATAVDAKNPATDPVKRKSRIATMLTQEGNCYLKLKKTNDAISAFEKAAELDPNPGTAFFNLCATQYNTGNIEGALRACDKAIAAQPDRADAYFIKGSLLISDSKTDKEGKLIPPPGTVEALKKYLELAPNGAHADDVQQMLAMVGAKVETTYSNRK